jgi:hypothetical protein
VVIEMTMFIDPDEFAEALYDGMVYGGATEAEARSEANLARASLDGADVHGITCDWTLERADPIDVEWLLAQGRPVTDRDDVDDDADGW